MALQKPHLFIDTNAFLSFFAYTKDDVEELKKLASLIKMEQVKLYLTEQVRDEFYRNREKKLFESISQFEKSLVPQVRAPFYPLIPTMLRFWGANLGENYWVGQRNLLVPPRSSCRTAPLKPKPGLSGPPA